MNQLTLMGTVVHVSPIETNEYNGKTYRKCKLVLATDGQYPQEVLFECSGRILDNLPAVGTIVNVDFDVRGRAYTRKDTGEKAWFTTLAAYAITRASNATADRIAAASNEDIPF